MLVSLVLVFFVREPKLPFKSNTVAAMMYYLCGDDDMVQGLGEFSITETNALRYGVRSMGSRYRFGTLSYDRGFERVGVRIEETGGWKEGFRVIDA